MTTIKFIIILFAFSASRVVAARCMMHTYDNPPDSIICIEDRAEYMALEIANNINPADTSLFSTPNLALDYIYLLSQMKMDRAKHCVSVLLEKFSAYENNLSKLLWLMERYLHNGKSPLYNDELYIVVLEVILESEIDDSFKIAPTYQIEIANNNRIGKMANNFNFSDGQGKKCNLYGIQSPHILIVFSRSSCDYCKITKKLMLQNSLLTYHAKTGKLLILYIDFEEELQKQEETPKWWINGRIINDEINIDELYEIQFFPCFYLLDNYKRVLLKEADWERCNNYIIKRSHEWH